MKRVLLVLVLTALPLAAPASPLKEGDVSSPVKTGPAANVSAEAVAFFFKAAQDRDADTLKAMLAKGFDPNYMDEYGQTAILFSILAGDSEGVGILLDAGANSNTADSHGSPVLSLAADEGYLEIVQSLVKKGADVHRADADGSTALIEAAGKNHLDILKALIDAGADPNLAAANGVTPVWAASFEGLAEIVEYLLPLSKDVNVKDKTGKRTLLMNVVEWKQAGLAKALVARGAEVNAVDERGWTPLMWAAKSDAPEIAGMLLEKGADPDVTSRLKETALTIAKKENHTAVVALLSKVKPRKKK